MFDVGFSEVLLCAIVALLVLGPDKLPGAVRTASLWIARFRRTVGTVQAEFEREIGTDDIRRQLHNEEVLKTLRSGQEELQSLQNELRVIEHGDVSKANLDSGTPPADAYLIHPMPGGGDSKST